MRGKRWSISGWLTRWFVLTVGVSVLVISAVSIWIVRESVVRELDALIVEEFQEMRADLSRVPTPAGFERLTAKYAREHPANPLAWRVWDGERGAIWGEFGSEELLLLAPEVPTDFDRTIEPKSGFRWRCEQLDSGLIVGLLLDGTWQSDLLHRLVLVLGIFGTIVAAVTATCGVYFGRRLAGYLHDVAVQMRAVSVPSETQVLAVEGAPEEVREVADALCEMLAKIRREQDRAQLMSRGLAHELRSPIQNLMGEAEVSLLRKRSVEEYRTVLESQVEELRDLGRVVDNLVMLCSPSQAGPQVFENFDLEDEASLRLERNRGAAERAGVKIEFETEGDLDMDGDREALLLALNNLVGNAIKWSPHGGVVLLTIVGGKQEVVISVDDEGPGVPEAERDKIFEPFYSAPYTSNSDDAREPGRTGYGLGLALVKSAVLAHHGTIKITSSERGGARFEVRIPRVFQ